MRLRNIALIALILAVIGGLVWAYGSNGGRTATAVGAGGLPLIKADATPAKIPPEEPEGEIIPNADSTVFEAMGTETAEDPSMKNVAPVPEEDEEKANTEFAGFRTGFAIPRQPERKVESLFGDEPTKAEEPASTDTEAEGASKYLSGIAPDAVEEKESAEANEVKQEVVPQEPIQPAPEEAKRKVEEQAKPAPEPEQEEAVKEEPATPVEATEAAKEEPTAPVDAANTDISAQALEAQEKILIMPASKPPVPNLEPKLDKKQQAVKEEVKQDTPGKPSKTLENVVSEIASAPTPATTPAPKAEEPIAQIIKPAQSPAAGGNNYYIQLASGPASADNAATWNKLKVKYPQALQGLVPSYNKVEIPSKGSFVRVQAGPMSQADANKRCAMLRSVNPSGGCLVLRR
ncbi:MAG: SPOR domain-containing protein [Alphaproteobacteria bacterium]|nr:SPOR domain-containing protein [Alphaproteobacteria bacterium]